tara:strand:+ start:72187 stop:73425 length:1239 start_codon:yes stop_codon:yes gene_type:complete
MAKRWRLIIVSSALLWGIISQTLLAKVLYESGVIPLSQQDQHVTISAYFAPTLVETGQGTILLFTQGRIASDRDNADKLIMLFSSDDKGKTWSKPRAISEHIGLSDMLSAVVDKQTGRVYIFFESSEQGNRKQRYMFSDDHGKSWSPFFAHQLKINNLRQKNQNGFNIFQPTAQAIQLNHSKFKHRIVVAGYGPWRMVGEQCSDKAMASYYFDPKQIEQVTMGQAIITDFTMYPSKQPQCKQRKLLVNHSLSLEKRPIQGEVSITELANGDLLMISRRNQHAKGEHAYKHSSISQDGGASWSSMRPVQSLPQPKCYGSLVNLIENDSDLLLYSTPQSTKRVDGRVYFSLDKGLSWSSKSVTANAQESFSYSNMLVLSDNSILLIYNQGHHGAQGLKSLRFNSQWLTDFQVKG